MLLLPFKVSELVFEDGILRIEIVARALRLDGRRFDNAPRLEIEQRNLAIANGAESPEIALWHEVVVLLFFAVRANRPPSGTPQIYEPLLAA
jgi:hypothetical protein